MKLNQKSGKVKMSTAPSRQEALLGGANKHQIEKQQEEVDVMLKKLNLTDSCEEYKAFRPKDDNGYKTLINDWMKEFHAKYLGLDKKH